MPADEMRSRFAAARVARLATLRSDGSPHLVPVTFAVDGDALAFAVDAKPKTTQRLQRIRNIERDPRVSLLVDEYADDWSRLWWVRIDGTAQQVEDVVAERWMTRLQAKYEQYQASPPAGLVVEIRIDRWTGWQAT
ncbi:MAG TPA: TIGR03668 family PPOX class F420-dependent oxidoreductase [Actinomycetes bacterium]|nr:TIGR03668 family PPOX class F420-dependent oxidoreductase [Actinomycetes bacterium]